MFQPSKLPDKENALQLLRVSFSLDTILHVPEPLSPPTKERCPSMEKLIKYLLKPGWVQTLDERCYLNTNYHDDENDYGYFGHISNTK